MLYPVLQSITRILQFCRGTAAGLAGAVDDIFVAAQLGQAHGAAGMQLLGADAHFAPQAKLSAIGKAGGGVDIHGGAVHTGDKAVCGGIVRRDDGLTVVGGMAGNVGNGSIHIIHHGNGQDVVQKFSVKLLLAGGCSGNDGGGALIQRDDDKVETVRNRLKVYHQETEPLKGYYEKKGALVPVDNQPTIEATTKVIMEALGI